MTVKRAEQWPLKTTAANTQKKTVSKFDFSVFTMETSLEALSPSSAEETQWAKFYPPFYLCGEGQNFPLCVLSKQFEVGVFVYP